MTLCRRASAACTLSAIVRVTLIKHLLLLFVLGVGGCACCCRLGAYASAPRPQATAAQPPPKDAPIRPVSFSGSRPREGAATPRRKTRSSSRNGRCWRRGAVIWAPPHVGARCAPKDQPMPHAHRVGTAALTHRAGATVLRVHATSSTRPRW